MVRRIVALVLALCVVQISVASAAEQCVSHVRTHCGHQQHQEQHQGSGQSRSAECCQLGTACAPHWALTARETAPGRVVHARPVAVEPGVLFSLRVAPEPPPPRA